MGTGKGTVGSSHCAGLYKKAQPCELSCLAIRNSCSGNPNLSASGIQFEPNVTMLKGDGHLIAVMPASLGHREQCWLRFFCSF